MPQLLEGVDDHLILLLLLLEGSDDLLVLLLLGPKDLANLLLHALDLLTLPVDLLLYVLNPLTHVFDPLTLLADLQLDFGDDLGLVGQKGYFTQDASQVLFNHSKIRLLGSH